MSVATQKFYWPLSVRWFILICIGLVAISIFQDYYYSVRNHSSFYFSESILFNAFWIFFLLGFQVLFTILYSDKQKKMFRYALAISGAITIHWLVFAIYIYSVSSLFYEHAYSILHTMKYSVSTLSLSTLLIYGIGLLVYVRRPSLKVKFLDRIQVKTANQTKSIEVNDIVCIQSESPYVSICTDENKFLYAGTLKSLEEQLDPSLFVRIHKSCIVNLVHIESYTSRKNGDYDVRMKNDMTVRLSRNHLTSFKSQL